MSERIMTLFGEEYIPEQPKGPAKTRVKKKQEEIPAEENNAGEEVTEDTTKEIAPPEIKTPEAVVPNEIKTEEKTAERNQAPKVAAPQQQTEEEKITGIPGAREPEPIAAQEVREEERAAVQEEEEHPDVTGQTEKVEEEKTFLIPEDWKGDKNYYTIGEVAELFKVKTSHIRFWTNEFKLKVRTTRKGDRLFTPDQIRELRAINHLVKERGFTLTGAKAKMKAQKKMDVETVDLKTSLKQLREKLLRIREQLI